MTKRMEALALSIFMWAACVSLPPAPGARAETLNPGETTGTTVKALFINVGKGDAILLMLGEQRYLIDTGTRDSADAMLKALEYYQVTHLDGVIITHTDKDHVGGLELLLESGVQVDALYAPLLTSEKKPEKHPVYKASQASGVPLTWLEAGQSLSAGEGFTLSVLGPRVQDDENENNNSLVLRVDTPQGSLLLTGDMELEEEQSLLDGGAFTAATVLKVAHHGDGDASGKTMIAMTRPQVAVISTNTAEEPDTPDSSVLGRLWGVGTQVFLTEKATCGVRVSLSAGQATTLLENYENVPAAATGLRLSAIDPENDTVALTNDGAETLSLNGCTLTSTRGGEVFAFPDGTQIASGQTLTVGTQSTEGACDYVWSDQRVWHRKKLDEAILRDGYGRELARSSNGLSE